MKCEHMIGLSTPTGPKVMWGRRGNVTDEGRTQEYLCDFEAEARNPDGEIVCSRHRRAGGVLL